MSIKQILNQIAGELDITVKELEMFVAPPSAVLALQRDPRGPSAEKVRSYLDRPFKKFVEYVLEEQFSNSCGSTSGWLDEVSSRVADAGKGTLADLECSAFVSKVLFTMMSNGGTWYCRCTLKVHSFFIECIERKACVYQSYFGHYSLADCLTKQTSYNRMQFMPLLEAAVHNDMALTNLEFDQDEAGHDLTPEQVLVQERKYRARWTISQKRSYQEINSFITDARKTLFLGLQPYHDLPTVRYRINTNPAPAISIYNNIMAAVNTHKQAWKTALTGGKLVRELL